MTLRDVANLVCGVLLVVCAGCERAPAPLHAEDLETPQQAERALKRLGLLATHEGVLEVHRAQIDGTEGKDWVVRARTLEAGTERLLVLERRRDGRIAPMMGPLELGEVPQERGVLEFVDLTGDARREIVVVLGGSDAHARVHTFIWHWGEMRDRAFDVPFHAEYTVGDVSQDGRAEIVAWDTPAGVLTPRVFEFTGYVTERRVDLDDHAVRTSITRATWSHAARRRAESRSLELGAMGAALAWEGAPEEEAEAWGDVLGDARDAWQGREEWEAREPALPGALELGAQRTREDAVSLVTLPGAWSDEQLAALRAMADSEGGLKPREEAFLRDRFAGDLKQRRPDCAGWARALIALSAEEVASLMDLSQTLVADETCRAPARDVFVRWARARQSTLWQGKGGEVHRLLLEKLSLSHDRRVRAAAARALFAGRRGGG